MHEDWQSFTSFSRAALSLPCTSRESRENGSVGPHSTLNATGAVSCHGLISLHSCHWDVHRFPTASRGESAGLWTEGIPLNCESSESHGTRYNGSLKSTSIYTCKALASRTFWTAIWAWQRLTITPNTPIQSTEISKQHCSRLLNPHQP